MLTKSNEIHNVFSVLLTIKIIKTVTILLLFTLPTARANEVSYDTLPLYSVSHGALKRSLNDEQRIQIISSNRNSKTPDPLHHKATAKSREVMLNSGDNLKLNNKQPKATRDGYYYADFAIYSVTSFLLDDFDGDGFFQTFSVIFDADIYSYTKQQTGEVYALLYTRKNGGPWIHYFTTDIFVIEDESTLDEYEVITTFLSGYSPDYYDVLIDLYQVGYENIVATYSSDDSNALYALPLESADYDETYIEVVQVSNGGSISVITLLIMVIILRFRSTKRC